MERKSRVNLDMGLKYYHNGAWALTYQLQCHQVQWTLGIQSGQQGMVMGLALCYLAKTLQIVLNIYTYLNASVDYLLKIIKEQWILIYVLDSSKHFFTRHIKPCGAC